MPFKDPKKAKEKNREYQRKWYQNHKKLQQKRVRERIDRNLKWLRNYKKDKQCIKCGASHPAILDFHHKGNDKEFNLSRSRDHSLKRIKDEIKKCDILCANCHRIEHWENETGAFKNRSRLDE